MTYPSDADPFRIACHDQEHQPFSFKGDHARSDTDKTIMTTTVEYNKNEHSQVPVERVLEYIAENAKSIQHVACSETLDTDSLTALCKILLENPAHTNVKTLSLPKNGLNARDAGAIAKLLYVNRTIRSLDLLKNNLGPDGTHSLVQPLVSANTTLIALNLTHNCLGVSGAHSIETLLKHTRVLQTLKIGYNHFGPKGIKTLAPRLAACRSLRSLSLSHNQIGSKGMHLLATKLSERNSALVYLDVACNRGGTRGTRAIADWLIYNKTLQTLVIANNECGPTGAGTSEQTSFHDADVVLNAFRSHFLQQHLPLSCISISRYVTCTWAAIKSPMPGPQLLQRNFLKRILLKLFIWIGIIFPTMEPLPWLVHSSATHLL